MQLTGDSFEPKWPDNLNLPIDSHTLDWPDSISPNELNQDVIIRRDSEYDNQYPDTSVIYPLFCDFPDASTSVWTTHDDESSPHDTLRERDPIQYPTTRDNEPTIHKTREGKDSKFHTRQSVVMNGMHATSLKANIWYHSSLTRLSDTLKTILWRTISKMFPRNQGLIHKDPAYTPRSNRKWPPRWILWQCVPATYTRVRKRIGGSHDSKRYIPRHPQKYIGGTKWDHYMRRWRCGRLS